MILQLDHLLSNCSYLLSASAISPFAENFIHFYEELWSVQYVYITVPTPCFQTTPLCSSPLTLYTPLRTHLSIPLFSSHHIPPPTPSTTTTSHTHTHPHTSSPSLPHTHTHTHTHTLLGGYDLRGSSSFFRALAPTTRKGSHPPSWAWAV